MTGESDDGRPVDLDEVDLVGGEYLEHHGFLSWLGLEVEAVEEGWLRMSVPYDEKLANLDAAGTVHGGVVATLVDTASGHAIRTTFDDPASVGVSTVEVNTRYLPPARDDPIATAEVVRAGGSLGVTDLVVESTGPDGEDTVVAVGGTTYRLFRDG
ncbi:PaaI family thioesterase [Halobacteriales archaeon QS_8_69_26]|nr:MAG: PaaI family thioesterase [Halobacteriales archaeon QS_8_69_26]